MSICVKGGIVNPSLDKERITKYPKCFSCSKGKCYDGSDKLKMIGNDCQIIEKNADAMIACLLKPGEDIQAPTADKLRRVLQLYEKWADLAK